MRPLLFLMLLVLICRCASAAASPDWSRQYALWIDGARRGYAEIEVKAQRYTVFERLELLQLRQRIPLEQRLEIRRDETGALLALKVQERSAQTRRAWHGRVRHAVLRLVPRMQDERARELHWSGELLLADQVWGELQAMARDGRAQLQRPMFDPWTGSWRTWTATRLKGPGWHFELSESARPADEWQRVELDEHGRLLRQSMRRAGLDIEWRPCAQACDGAVEQPLDLLAMQAVRSPFQIPEQARHGRLRYVLSRRDGQALQLPHSAEQQVVTRGARQVLTVCARCTDPEPDARLDPTMYLQSNAWVRSDDQRVRRFARKAGGGQRPAALRMRALERAVAERLRTIDMVGYHDAVHALNTGRGDCTEAAVLLAGAARAVGIPSRVVAGLVYSDRYSGRRDVFAPHFWMQAWVDGRWRSYDAALAGFDATHLAVAVGDGDPAQTAAVSTLLGQLQIEQLGQLPDPVAH